MHKIIGTLLLGALLSTQALAQGNFYVGGTIGNTSLDRDFEDFNLNFEDDDASWSAFAGVQATETFAIEASYNDFGDFNSSSNFDLTQTDVDAELTGYDVMAVLTVPVGPLRVFGKGGLVYWDSKAVAQIFPPVGPGFQLREEDNGTDLALGGGLELRLGDALSLRGELEWFDIEDTEEVYFASLGFTYRF